MESKHFVGKVSLRAIVVRDGKILIARDINDAATWEIPGGRLHEGEALEAGMERELREEIGVMPRLGSLIYSEQFHQTRDGSLHLMLTYEAFFDEVNEPVFVLDPHEVAEVRWIDRSEFGQYAFYDNCERALKAYWKLP
jgi:ADP-ribose pyrophosphatase YjhB (NUDIX family)